MKGALRHKILIAFPVVILAQKIWGRGQSLIPFNAYATIFTSILNFLTAIYNICISSVFQLCF